MKKLTKTLAGVATLAVSAGMLIGFAGGASAASPTPPWEPDSTNATGTITFYDNAGNIVTGGSIDATPFASYAVGSAVVRAGDVSADVQEAQPNPNAATALWNADQLTAFKTYPLATGPADVVALSQTHPVGTIGASDLTLDDFIQEFPNTDPSGIGCAYAATPAGCTNTAYQNLYQLRIKTATSGGTQTAQYDDADILVSGTTWTQVYPAALTQTATALTSSENPSTSGDNVTFKATITPATAGTVSFFDNGTTQIGTTQTVTATTNTAQVSTSTLSVGSHPITAVFTSTDTTAAGSTSPVVTQVVNPVAPSTTTTLSITGGNTTAGSDATLTTTVTSGSPAAPVTAGTVSFYDNGSTTPINPTPITSTTGTYTFDDAAGFAVGNHSVVAKFTPTNVNNFAASQSAPSTFGTQAAVVGACAVTGSVCSDTQYIEGNIPQGTIVISTDYSQQNPLNVGSFALTSDGREFQAGAAFNDIKVIDSLAGDGGYAVTALSSDLTDGKSNPGSTIDSQNVGLTNIQYVKGTGFTGNVGTTDNAAADPAVAPGAAGSAGLGVTPKNVFTTDHGLGTLTVSGQLTINAPTSTETGEFSGTITFGVTVS